MGALSTVVTARDDRRVSYRTSLRPHADVTLTGWPRDIVALGGNGIAPCGVLHTRQRGLRTGLVHASIPAPEAGSFMYVQDLTALNEYFDITGCSAGGTVGGEWPDIGFCVPAGETPLSPADGL